MAAVIPLCMPLRYEAGVVGSLRADENREKEATIKNENKNQTDKYSEVAENVVAAPCVEGDHLLDDGPFSNINYCRSKYRRRAGSEGSIQQQWPRNYSFFTFDHRFLLKPSLLNWLWLDFRLGKFCLAPPRNRDFSLFYLKSVPPIGWWNCRSDLLFGIIFSDLWPWSLCLSSCNCD